MMAIRSGTRDLDKIFLALLGTPSYQNGRFNDVLVRPFQSPLLSGELENRLPLCGSLRAGADEGVDRQGAKCSGDGEKACDQYVRAHIQLPLERLDARLRSLRMPDWVTAAAGG